jgi:hypothetical protein
LTAFSHVRSGAGRYSAVAHLGKILRRFSLGSALLLSWGGCTRRRTLRFFLKLRGMWLWFGTELLFQVLKSLELVVSHMEPIPQGLRLSKIRQHGHDALIYLLLSLGRWILFLPSRDGFGLNGVLSLAGELVEEAVDSGGLNMRASRVTDGLTF